MKEQLDKQHRDQDRVRIIKAAIQSGFTFTTVIKKSNQFRFI